MAGVLKKTTGLIGLAVYETPNERLNMVKEETDLQKLEHKLRAENELSLTRKMLTWKPWEPLVEEPPVNQWKWPL
ncbi:NADH dehydrogenase [ubiquinone] 1 alpha subcomplex subunit 5-like isoform X2 [Vombatus ursinus]|uniref:NADH dehydrogenase [ubiquinone] 1 alpha subcomplex subunit 5-like isoform X2 n=1 Tax=Vombatus ursinus TaxID=29139 RepID=UPI000FFD0621|nr:NADH dehydrogenase [ubiquinone] 1 alpha subcomplex subunit 5-like isoform X2 [Vombatus ursinus]